MSVIWKSPSVIAGRISDFSPEAVKRPVLHQPSCTTSPRPKEGSHPRPTAKTGSVEFDVAFGAAANGELSSTVVGLVALGLLGGAIAKSAQIPLHTWLPDAMEGPTPVSALIHAATMVTAGVYLVARANPIFASAPQAMVVVAAIGIFTAIFAASIALTQTDIKRVLAYSTLSQLGYMFAALGVGAWTAAIFHLMAHGFFKGLLFLGSEIGRAHV